MQFGSVAAVVAEDAEDTEDHLDGVKKRRGIYSGGHSAHVVLLLGGEELAGTGHGPQCQLPRNNPVLLHWRLTSALRKRQPAELQLGVLVGSAGSGLGRGAQDDLGRVHHGVVNVVDALQVQLLQLCAAPLAALSDGDGLVALEGGMHT